MNFLPVYLDSSALLKLILPEAERAALESAIERWPDRLTSELSAVECRRAVRRQPEAAVLAPRMEDVLSSLTLLRIDQELLRLAGTIGPPRLRSLDAIHLASALSIGDYPEAFITYDERLAAAARAAGLNVLTPGAE
ncbi:MAG: type II toxin-antitoxin system VapC family toxin [Vicinamibacterales bacterium]|nr:type II toxin-antitoxin system VapC family toxin [Vicinamibacterales bacterium]